MKNLLNLGKTLSRVEQKQIFGGKTTPGLNTLSDCDCPGGGGGGNTGGNNPDPSSCTSDADCGNMHQWANNGNPDCEVGDWTCGHWTTAQGTCTSVTANGVMMCVA
ncbi:hypothetical protein [Winogradskyella forsetii]|uniref:hypothetical protein n=1 Tax=Winogradskyella forsetii TaxID=2686077 RepID=UPI0015C0A871|nr:hypothetical protein [Winogradskyella forsetii]